MVPSEVMLMIASSDDSTMAAKSTWACSARLRSARKSRTAYCRRRSRRAARTVLTSVETWTGRFMSVMGPTAWSARKSLVDSGPGGVRTTRGKSDQGGWVESHPARRRTLSPRRASAVTTATPAPRSASRQTSSMVLQMKQRAPAVSRRSRLTAASRAVGGSTRTRSSSTSARSSHILWPLERLVRPVISRGAAEHTLEVLEWLPDLDAALAEAQLPNGPLVLTAPFLDDRDRLPHFANRLEIAEEDDGLGEVGRVDRRRQRADHTVLCNDEDGHHALVAEVREKLVKLGGEEPLLGHCVQIAVQAVDDDDLRPRLSAFPLGGPADAVGEFTWRELGRVNRLDFDAARIEVLGDIHPEAGRS